MAIISCVETLRITVLKEIPEDPQLAASWNELAMRMERPEVFYTYEWALAASRAFADTLRPLVLLAHGSDRLRGVAALATAGETCETVSFLASNTADYCDILSSPDQRAAVLRALFDELGRLGMRNLILANVPSESATLRELPAIAQSHGFRPHSRPAYECGVIAFGSDAERQELLKSVAGKDREKRALKKMAQLGPVRVVHLEADQIETQLHLIAEAQIVRFLATNRISPYVQPGRRRFLSELSRLLAPLGWLRVSQLEVGGEPIAWNFGFRFEGGWFWYLPTFRIEHEDLSPGSCLLRFLVEEGCADPSVKRLDLGLGDEAYKSRFANSAQRTSHVEVSANRVRHVAGVGRDWLAAKARKSPHVEQSLYVTRDRLRGLRKRIRETGLVATAGYSLGRAAHRVNSDDELLLFEAPFIGAATTSKGKLVSVDWKLLCDSAILFADDEPTLQYLMRCAQRLRPDGPQGYALLKPDGVPVHFTWSTDLDGFYFDEIDHRIQSASLQRSQAMTEVSVAHGAAAAVPGAAILFDSWTPRAHRGGGYYAITLREAAAVLEKQQRTIWGFSSPVNASSIRGLQKAGFVYRFSLVRKRRLMRSSVSRFESPSDAGLRQQLQKPDLPSRLAG